MFRSGLTFAVPLAYFCLLVDLTILLFLKYHVSTIYYMEWSTILSHFFIYIHAKKKLRHFTSEILYSFS